MHSIRGKDRARARDRDRDRDMDRLGLGLGLELGLGSGLPLLFSLPGYAFPEMHNCLSISWVSVICAIYPKC